MSNSIHVIDNILNHLYLQLAAEDEKENIIDFIRMLPDEKEIEERSGLIMLSLVAFFIYFPTKYAVTTDSLEILLAAHHFYINRFYQTRLCTPPM